MPLTLQDLEAIQSDALADDVPIDLARMATWTLEQAVAYFESGGEEFSTQPSPAQADPVLTAVLDAASLTHHAHLLSDQCAAQFMALPRVELLARLKALGMDSLSDRQKLSTALLKLARRNTLAPATEAPSPNNAITGISATATSITLDPPVSGPSPAPAAGPAALMDVADAAAASTSNDEAIPGDPTLHALLTSVSLGHLSTELCNQSVGELSVLARPDLLTRLKVCGVAKLTERQKLATALAKERKRADAASQVVLPYVGRVPWVAPTAEQLGMLPRPCGALKTAMRVKKAELRSMMESRPAGEHYGLPFPHTPAELRQMGAPWLTQAFHAAGTLPSSCRVVRISRWEELFPNGDPNETRGDGGAALKVLVDVEYDGPAAAVAALHTDLFVKLPLPFRQDNEAYFLSCEVTGHPPLDLSLPPARTREPGMPTGTPPCDPSWTASESHDLPPPPGAIPYSQLHGDFPEVMFNRCFAAALAAAGLATPRYYFGEYSRESASYLLITERLPFGKAVRAGCTIGSWEAFCATKGAVGHRDGAGQPTEVTVGIAAASAAAATAATASTDGTVAVANGLRQVALGPAWQVRSKYLDRELPHSGASHYEACMAVAGRLTAIFHSMEPRVKSALCELLNAPGNEPFAYVGGPEFASDQSRHTVGLEQLKRDAHKAGIGGAGMLSFTMHRGINFATNICPQVGARALMPA